TFKTKAATDKALPALRLPTVLTQNNVLSFALSKLTTALLPNFQGATEEASPSTTATSSCSPQSKETSAPTNSSNHSWLSRFRVARSQLSIAPEVLRSEEHTSELQSRFDLVCRLLLEKKKPTTTSSFPQL